MITRLRLADPGFQALVLDEAQARTKRLEADLGRKKIKLEQTQFFYHHIPAQAGQGQQLLRRSVFWASRYL